MSRKHKLICTTLNCIKHFHILASANTGCILISAFASLIDVLMGVMSCANGLKISAIGAGIKN